MIVTMTLPSQFSLEEENFYKDIQDLVKKGSQNEKELSLFLERYMDLLARADLDDETFIINFTKAGLIIEASAKVYGTKVDKLWMNLEHVLESLKSKSQGQLNKKKPDSEEDVGDDIDVDAMCDDLQEGKRKLPNSGRRRKKLGDVLFSSDDFIEIDNFTGLLGRNMNETNNIVDSKIKLCEKVPNMFIKNKTKKKKVDVCLNKCLEDKDVIRLRDWVISEQCLLVKEIYTSQPENTIFIANSLDEEELRNAYCNSEAYGNDDDVIFGVMEVETMPESIKVTSDFKDEKNNNTELRIGLETNVEKPLNGENFNSSDGRNSFLEELHVSRESDVAKFPNVIDQASTGYLMDVDEVFWNSSKFQDVIPSKKRRSGKTNKLPCQLCASKKVHKKKTRKCIEGKKIDCLDAYFTPHVQPAITEPNFGILPDEELYSIFKLEMKLIEQLGKIDTCKNINEAYHPDESPEEIRNFLGFDGFENYLMKGITELQEDEISEENLVLDHLEDDNDNYVGDAVSNQEFDLPFPVTENNLPSICVFADNDPELQANEVLMQSESEYQKLVLEELKDHYAAKNSFAKNKELGIKISKWHEMIADKIQLSQKRGALNMNSLAEKIMNAFPATLKEERPVLMFKDLVKNQSRRDIPRYFFACLQLTNEGNLDIGKSCREPLATDCMIVTQLRTARTNYELEECSSKSPSKELNSSKSIVVPIKRKRTSLSNSSFIVDDGISKKKKCKQKILKNYKRSKNFNSMNDSKRRKCSVSSSDSVTYE